MLVNDGLTGVDAAAVERKLLLKAQGVRNSFRDIQRRRLRSVASSFLDARASR